MVGIAVLARAKQAIKAIRRYLDGLVKAIGSDLPIELVLGTVGQANFLADLAEPIDRIGGFGAERNKTGTKGRRIGGAKAAINIAATIKLGVLITGNRGQGQVAEIIGHIGRCAIGLERLVIARPAIIRDFFRIKACNETIGAGLDDIGAEQLRRAAKLAPMQVQIGIER